MGRSGHEKETYNSVMWELVCRLRQLGGLGISNVNI